MSYFLKVASKLLWVRVDFAHFVGCEVEPHERIWFSQPNMCLENDQV